jgi:uncharacterized membrane protein YraQ (UPF0718 family)
LDDARLGGHVTDEKEACVRRIPGYRVKPPRFRLSAMAALLLCDTRVVANVMLERVGHALGMAFAMGWAIFWPLVLGFALSGVVQAVVPKRTMARVLPDDSPRSLAIACGLGAASSSCSYAAVALARSVFRKGADFTAAMAFELASTNLVAELSIVMLTLMGWRFMVAELLGAP